MKPWRLVLEPREGAPDRPIVRDAISGDDVSGMFPTKTARRLARSLRTATPLMMPVLLLGTNGRPRIDWANHRVDRVVRRVLVVPEPEPCGRYRTR